MDSEGAPRWLPRVYCFIQHLAIASLPLLEMELQTNPSEAFLSWSSQPGRGDTVGRRLQGGCKSSLVKFKRVAGERQVRKGRVSGLGWGQLD